MFDLTQIAATSLSLRSFSRVPDRLHRDEIGQVSGRDFLQYLGKICMGILVAVPAILRSSLGAWIDLDLAGIDERSGRRRDVMMPSDQNHPEMRTDEDIDRWLVDFRVHRARASPERFRPGAAA